MICLSPCSQPLSRLTLISLIFHALQLSSNFLLTFCKALTALFNSHIQAFIIQPLCLFLSLAQLTLISLLFQPWLLTLFLLYLYALFHNSTTNKTLLSFLSLGSASMLFSTQQSNTNEPRHTHSLGYNLSSLLVSLSENKQQAHIILSVHLW